MVISRRAIRAIALKRGRVVWAAERAITTESGPGIALSELASERPRGTRCVRVALETDSCQVKILHGFPRLSGSRLQRAVSLQPHRWFLKGPTALVTAARWSDRSTALVAAVESGLLEEIVDGMEHAGMEAEWFSPVVCCVAQVLPDGTHERLAGQLAEEIEVRRGALQTIRRRPRSEEALRPASIPALQALGDRAPEWVGAYAAARTRPAIAFVPTALQSARTRYQRRFTIAVIAAGIVAWIAAGLIYGSRLHVESTRARAVIQRLQPEVNEILAAEQEMGKFDAAFGTVADIDAGRSRDLELLATLSRALPDSVYLVSISCADRFVDIAGYGIRAGAAIAKLATTDGIEDVNVNGPVTLELRDGVSWERFAAKFTWNPETSQ
ncbi:MAG: PilN domain-containing protein [Gemmatimonadetes bacterium]|nr:PilN domain-containing protein [Gemmatimonadota bacterium]